MASHVIVSYDGTAGDRDALELGRLLHRLGAPLTLAYVRHAAAERRDREQLAQREAQALLDHGAELLDDPTVGRQVVLSPSTGEGLGRLAAETGAEIIVFGSDYRTPVGRVAVGRSAQTLLENGPAALALAPAGYRARELSRIGVLPGSADDAATETARALAAHHGASVRATAGGVDLLVVGSRPEAREGHVMLTASAVMALEEARCPVLAVARGVPLTFDALVAA